MPENDVTVGFEFDLEVFFQPNHFRHSVALLGFCSIMAPLTNLTDYTFAIDSIPLNLAMLYFSYQFYRKPGADNAKKLFRLSLFYLPMVMMLMIIGKPYNREQIPITNPEVEMMV